jgi:hypothetical protein
MHDGPPQPRLSHLLDLIIGNECLGAEAAHPQPGIFGEDLGRLPNGSLHQQHDDSQEEE